MIKNQPLAISSAEAAVYRAIRSQITALQLAPGRRLFLEELAQAFGVSHTPVRLALRRLERDGLVVSEERRGSLVAPLHIEELEEIHAIRIGVESLLARFGAPRATTNSIKRMEARLNEVDAAAEKGDWEKHILAQWAFRDACYERARRPHLSRLLGQQRRRAGRYVRLLSSSLEAIAELRLYQADLLAACRTRDGAAAETSTYAAQNSALERLQTVLRTRTDLGFGGSAAGDAAADVTSPPLLVPLEDSAA